MWRNPPLTVVALGCLVAAVVWGRSARRLRRAWLRIDDSSEGDAVVLARSAFRKEAHTALLYALLAASLGVTSVRTLYGIPLLALALPVFISLRYGPRFLHEARLAEERSLLERRAEEVLSQDELAPRR